MEFLGRNGTQVLFKKENFGAVVDEASNTVVVVDSCNALLASADWDAKSGKPLDISVELANAAVTDLDIKVLGNTDRSNMYTIPDSVVAEAKRGLTWRREEKRGGTPVGLNTARTLAQGGQIGIQKIRHIAKYFPRHEVDKKGKGWKPGQPNYPSNGRIAWALWGGDAAWRWAANIVERDNKAKANNSVTASIEEFIPVERIDYNSFSPSQYEPDFYVRIRLDGSGVDRLYKVDAEGYCTVWDDGCWDDLGHIDHDFITYDKSLDDPYDTVEKIHVPVDRESAIKISAMLDNAPLEPVLVQKVNFDESDLIEKAIPEIDWTFLDQLSEDEVYEVDEWDDGLVAAGEAPTNQDGNYTPEERSEKAKGQVRDQLGKFAKTGSTVVVGNDPKYTGKILSINAETQEANVEFPSGQVVAVPANQTQLAEDYKPIPTAGFPEFELDTSGILGEPRVPIDSPKANLPGRLPPLTTDSLQVMLNDWSTWVGDQRLSPEHTGDPVIAEPPVSTDIDINSVLGKYYTGSFNPDGTPKPGWSPATTENVYNNPLLRDWLDEKYKNKNTPEGSYHNNGWYRPSRTYGEYAPAVEGKKGRNEVVSKKNKNDFNKKFDPTLSVADALIAAAEDKKKPTYEITPEKSDVAPMYVAIVAEDDPSAVMELVAVVPAGHDTTEPSTFKRADKKWVRDDRILSDLKSPTPPPTIVLSTEQLAEVVYQVDGGVVASVSPILAAALSINAFTAAGGADRNRGNAEKLRRYWTVGKGGLKIRWGAPGDWTRCHKYLAKYLGPRAKGYCALRHKEMTGMWPGDKRNVGKKKSLVSSIEALRPEEKVVELSTLRARVDAAKAKVNGRGGIEPTEFGSKFVIPLVIPEGKESGDGRIFEKGVITMRDLPLPLLWQIKTGQGHDGSVVVGQITHMERTEDGIGNAVGVFDKGEFGREAERLVRHGFIRGVSADMDMFEADEEETSEESGKVQAGRIVITNARIMAVTIVPKPAFQECYIQIVDDGNEIEEEEMAVPDGVYVEGVNPLDASALVACGMVAGAIPLEPPTEWFDNPKLTKATPLTITDEGRVFGHIAAWHVDHIGMAFGTRPPRSRSKYSYFHTGIIRTAEGKDVPVGQLTLAGGHAGLEASAEEAVRHYDDTASAFADVHAGEDAYGIWVSGALRPGTTPEQIRAARASAPSGDWRPIKGHLELVAVCQVNVPGFPIARARVASGQVMALVAAGASTLAQMKHDPLAELNAKVDALEAAHKKVELASMADKMAELSARVASLKAAADLDAEYMLQEFEDDTEAEMAVISRRERLRLAEEGKALKDGSFPIRNVNDLRNAIQAYGRAKAGKRGLVQKHIMKRARALGKVNLVPEKWKAASVDVADLRARALAAAATLKQETESTDKD